MSRMSDQKEAWEKWYRSNPTVWKGSPFPLPDLPKGSRVLDVGCGTGNTILQAIEMNLEPVGIDISNAAIEKARDRIISRGAEADLVLGDVLDRGLELGKFDCILLHHVLDNMLLEGRMDVVSRTKELLLPGGIVSIQDLSIDDIRYGKGRNVEKNTFEKGDGIRLHFFDIEETREIFNGFEEIRLEQIEWTQGKGDRALKKSRIVGVFQLPSF